MIIYNQDGTIREQWEGQVPEVRYAALTFVQFLGLAIMAGGMDDDDYATARANPSLMIYFDALTNAQGIERDDPMTARGGAKFVALGMLTQEGWDAMLANWPVA